MLFTYYLLTPVDRDRDCVVVAIRGTLSLEDCITDVTIDAVEVNFLCTLVIVNSLICLHAHARVVCLFVH